MRSAQLKAAIGAFLAFALTATIATSAQAATPTKKESPKSIRASMLLGPEAATATAFTGNLAVWRKQTRCGKADTFNWCTSEWLSDSDEKYPSYLEVMTFTGPKTANAWLKYFRGYYAKRGYSASLVNFTLTLLTPKTGKLTYTESIVYRRIGSTIVGAACVDEATPADDIALASCSRNLNTAQWSNLR